MLAYSLTDAKNNFSAYTAAADAAGEPFKVTKQGRDWGVFVPSSLSPDGVLAIFMESDFDSASGKSSRIGIAAGETLYEEGWDSQELNAEIAGMFGHGA